MTRNDTSGEDEQLLRVQGQAFAAVLGDEHGVLDAHAHVALDVDAGLDGADHAGGEPVALRPTERRRLVYLEADAVTGAVTEALAVAGRDDDGARGLVDVTAPVGTGTHGGQTGELRLENGLVDGALRRRDAAGRERTRDVGAIAGDARAGVDQDQLAGLDAPLTGDRVGVGGVIAGGDDRRERLVLGAAAVVLLAQSPGDLAFGAAGQALAGMIGLGARS